MLIKLGVKYGSKEACDLCDKIGYILAQEAILASNEETKIHGDYPKFNRKVFDTTFYKNHLNYNLKGLANSQLLTIAPTGSISTMIGVSGGIEPIFANYYTRTTKSLHGEDVTYKVYTPIVKEYMEKHNLTDDSQLPDYFVTSADLTVDERINMQAVWQSHIDASISSTVNLPYEATVEDVKAIYVQAWERGLKGVTVYRAGCARSPILATETKEKEKKNGRSLGLERHLVTGCGSLHICAYFNEDGELQNTYLSKGSTGGCNNFMIGLSRMISLAARNGVGIYDIVDQLKSSGTCPSYAVRKATKNDVSIGSSCPVAIGNALMDMWKEAKEIFKPENYAASTPISAEEMNDQCPECGGSLKHEMGCVTCPNCGYSKCG